MARGKQAARAANRRAAMAADTVESLSAQLANERAKSSREIADLKNERDRLAGRLTSEVAAMAATKVERIQSDYAAARTMERAKQRENGLKLSKIMTEGECRLPHESYEVIAALFGLSLGEFLTHDHIDNNRTSRRVTASKRKALDSELDQIAARGNSLIPKTGRPR